MFAHHLALDFRIESRRVFLPACGSQGQRSRARLCLTTQGKQQRESLHCLIRDAAAQNHGHVRACTADSHRADPAISTRELHSHTAGIEVLHHRGGVRSGK